MKCFVVLCLVALSSASPLFSPYSMQYHAQDELGQYTYGYDGGPSAKHETRTFDGVTRGGYSYLDSHGLIQSTAYVSDPMQGFRVAATNLPVGPAVPGAGAVVAAHPIVAGHPVVTPVGPINPDLEVAKAAHFAAHAAHLAKLGRKKRAIIGWPYAAPLHPDGTVADTPEVAVTKAAHFAAHAAARSGVHPLVHSPYLYHPGFAPLHADGTVADTPEVVAAKVHHFAAHNMALSRGRRSAPLNPDGTVADTPEVVAARIAHLNAKAAPYGVIHGYPYLGYHGLNAVGDTPAVAIAKANHLATHYNTRLRDSLLWY